MPCVRGGGSGVRRPTPANTFHCVDRLTERGRGWSCVCVCACSCVGWVRRDARLPALKGSRRDAARLTVFVWRQWRLAAPTARLLPRARRGDVTMVHSEAAIKRPRVCAGTMSAATRYTELVSFFGGIRARCVFAIGPAAAADFVAGIVLMEAACRTAPALPPCPAFLWWWP